jgi:hypothetical protein
MKPATEEEEEPQPSFIFKGGIYYMNRKEKQPIFVLNCV